MVGILGADRTKTATDRKTCGTFHGELIRLRVWPKQLRVIRMARASDGVYWIPEWNRTQCTTLLVGPAQVTALHRPSATFGRPEGSRSHSRRNEVHNQIRDLLETSGITLSPVASDINGVSGIVERLLVLQD